MNHIIYGVGTEWNVHHFLENKWKLYHKLRYRYLNFAVENDDAIGI